MGTHSPFWYERRRRLLWYHKAKNPAYKGARAYWGGRGAKGNWQLITVIFEHLCYHNTIRNILYIQLWVIYLLYCVNTTTQKNKENVIQCLINKQWLFSRGGGGIYRSMNNSTICRKYFIISVVMDFFFISKFYEYIV